ncbi:UNVERIFIED_ORG: hypothetical protein QE398_001685 [Atlantibacter sp. SORGH_AS 304]|nr:hypothetical protein [Atlantibacter sp. SORGH_AS_0304]
MCCYIFVQCRVCLLHLVWLNVKNLLRYCLFLRGAPHRLEAKISHCTRIVLRPIPAGATRLRTGRFGRHRVDISKRHASLVDAEEIAGWRRTPYPAYGEVRNFVGRISAAPSGKDMRPLPDGGVRLIRPTGKCEICRPDKRSAIRQRYEATARWRRTPYPAYGEVRNFLGRISAAPSGKDMRPLPDGGVRLIRRTGKCEIS